jgi:hypothetical protein
VQHVHGQSYGQKLFRSVLLVVCQLFTSMRCFGCARPQSQFRTSLHASLHASSFWHLFELEQQLSISHCCCTCYACYRSWPGCHLSWTRWSGLLHPTCWQQTGRGQETTRCCCYRWAPAGTVNASVSYYAMIITTMLPWCVGSAACTCWAACTVGTYREQPRDARLQHL